MCQEEHDVALLSVQDLRTYFYTDFGQVKAVDGVSFEINEKEIVGIVGESGCGKSVTQLSMLKLIPSPPGRIESGRVMFEGRDLLQFTSEGPEMRSVRGGKIAFIFQEPMTSLNPTLKVFQQISEMLVVHTNLEKSAIRSRTIDLLEQVGIPDAKRRVDDYPYQFSGGMRQRVMIAMALACNPKILIADEPTTALDVTTQAQILQLMQNMVAQHHTSLIIVTHNLGVVARYAERIYVMYAGRIVESGTSDEIFAHPRHPYTIGLLKCVPRLDEEEGRKLNPVVGVPPDLIDMPPTCSFLPRCPYSVDKCQNESWPSLRRVDGQQFVSCFINT
ncbi:MAG: ABC transporter ATP-binding protein [Planctomycetota bacterium]|nr:MAG: ABC transporter ATP-binding protein [Planctomycetota bacterium]